MWTTDKDGPILDLLAAEILARTGQGPGEHYRELDGGARARRCYTRIDAPATPAQKARLADALARRGDATRRSRASRSPRSSRARRATARAIGGLKVTTEHGWFAARPSGTENIVKIYAESFRSAEHLDRILAEARPIMADALAGTQSGEGLCPSTPQGDSSP